MQLKNSALLLYTGLLLLGMQVAPVQAQILSSEAIPESELEASAEEPTEAVDQELITPASELAEAETAISASESESPELDALEADPMSQVTSVSQLRDVSPGDWAYEALRSLVERYGCIAGYPDGTFRGNRSLSRYEFAAGMNACLQQIERLIGTDKLPEAELATLQRLSLEFEAEIASLGAWVDNLEGQVAFLEDHQFYTTTKLFGQVIVGIQGRTENEVDFFPVDGVKDTEAPGTQINLISNTQLSLFTQFSPRSILLTGLQAGTGGTAPRLINDTRLGYEGNTEGDLVLSDLTYPS